nr:MAG TPA: hypothetical protein [Caudoviricetes sp.]
MSFFLFSLYVLLLSLSYFLSSFLSKKFQFFSSSFFSIL